MCTLSLLARVSRFTLSVYRMRYSEKGYLYASHEEQYLRRFPIEKNVSTGV